MTRDPNVKVLILNGYYDIATVFYGVEYSINHLGLSKEIKDNIPGKDVASLPTMLSTIAITKALCAISAPTVHILQPAICFR